MTATVYCTSLSSKAFHLLSTTNGLHEIILPSLITVLVARCLHLILIIKKIVRVILLVLELFPLLLDPGILFFLNGTCQRNPVGSQREGQKPSTYSCLLHSLVLLPQLRQPFILLFLQVRMLLNLGLVESVDNRVLSRANQYFLDLSSKLVGS